MKKPDIDPNTGCGHIRNYEGWRGTYRGCSYCSAGICVQDSAGNYLEEVNVDHCWSCGTTFDHTDDERREEPMSNWISVQETPPDLNQFVLAAFGSGEMVVACMKEDESGAYWRAQTDDDWESDMDFMPTWWMPLPEAPTSEADIREAVKRAVANCIEAAEAHDAQAHAESGGDIPGELCIAEDSFTDKVKDANLTVLDNIVYQADNALNSGDLVELAGAACEITRALYQCGLLNG